MLEYISAVVIIKIFMGVFGLIILPGVLISSGKRFNFTQISIGIVWGFGITIFFWTVTAIWWFYDFHVMLVESLFFLGVGAVRYKISFSGLEREKNIFPEISKYEILLLAGAFLFFLAPLRVMYLPFDTDAQGFGLQALTVRDGGTVDTLMPLYPKIKSVYSPAYFVIIAFLSDLAGSDIPTTMLVFSHLNAFLIVVLSMSIGRMLYGQLFGVLFSAFFIIGLGSFTALMDAHYTVILATLILLALIAYLLNTVRKFSWHGLLASSFFLSLLVYTHPDTLIAFLLGFIPFWLVVHWSKEGYDKERFFITICGISILGVLFSLPWLLKILDSLWSPEIMRNLQMVNFRPSLLHYKNLFWYQGGVITIIALCGMKQELERRTLLGLFAIIWLTVLIDFGLFGIMDGILRYLPLQMTLHFYPFGLSWNGVILPLAFLASLFTSVQIEKKIHWTKKICLTIALLGSFAMICASYAVIAGKKFNIPIYGTFSTPADIAAMKWIRANTSRDSVIMNYPGYIGHWVPVIAERRTLNFRDQPWFVFSKRDSANQGPDDILTGDLINTSEHDFYQALTFNKVNYIVVPQILTSPSHAKQALVFNTPPLERKWGDFRRFDFLKLVFEEKGAQVWKVL